MKEPSTRASIQDEKPASRSDDGKTFDSNLQVLFSELELAIKWSRPSILLAVYKSEFTQERAASQLERLLRGLGQDVVRIRGDREHADIPGLILEHGNAERTSFFVSGIDQGGGEQGKSAYSILNMQREAFVDHKIKAVFWLTRSEASNLPKHAPDFWAFRHRVVEFASPRASSRNSLPAGAMIWRLSRPEESTGAIRDAIQANSELLGELPEVRESASQRIELLEILGYLSWKLGKTAEALDAFSRGILISQNDALAQARAWLLNGVAIISYERRDFHKALEIYGDVLGRHEGEGFLWMNLSLALGALGKSREAIFRAEQALRLAPNDSRLWSSAGHLHVALGRLDEALPFFEKAIELKPDSEEHHASLAVCYNLMGLQEEALLALESIPPDPEMRQGYMGACKEAILGNLERSRELLRGALQAGEFPGALLQRDPNLRALIDAPLLAALR